MTKMVELTERKIKTTIIDKIHMFENVVKNTNMLKKET